LENKTLILIHQFKTSLIADNI